MSKEIALRRCRNFIRKAFRNGEIKGIEVGCFWEMAAKVLLYIPETYGTPMSDALEEMCTVESVLNDSGEFIYNVFRLKEAAQ